MKETTVKAWRVAWALGASPDEDAQMFVVDSFHVFASDLELFCDLTLDSDELSLRVKNHLIDLSRRMRLALELYEQMCEAAPKSGLRPTAEVE